MKKFISLSLLLVSLTANAFYFEQHGKTSDAHCNYWNLDRFSKINYWFTAGVSGSKSHGFDYEVPISRKGVDIIWCAIAEKTGNYDKVCSGLIQRGTRPFARYAQFKAPQNLRIKFQNLEDMYNQFYIYIMDTIYKDRMHGVNVGYILEVLVRYYFMDLTNIIDKRNFNITGGVEYAHSQNSNTIGELDIIVYHRKTCRVIGIGESKAASQKSSSRALRKAKEQLQRFANFIRQ